MTTSPWNIFIGEERFICQGMSTVRYALQSVCAEIDFEDFQFHPDAGAVAEIIGRKKHQA